MQRREWQRRAFPRSNAEIRGAAARESTDRNAEKLKEQEQERERERERESGAITRGREDRDRAFQWELLIRDDRGSWLMESGIFPRRALFSKSRIANCPLLKRRAHECAALSEASRPFGIKSVISRKIAPREGGGAAGGEGTGPVATRKSDDRLEKEGKIAD